MSRKIVFLDRASLPIALPPLKCAHEWMEFSSTRPEDVRTKLADAEIVITNKVGFDDALMSALPKLRLIAVAGTGANHIDVDAARARNIAVCNIRGYADSTVPEHALMLMLSLARNVVAYRQDLAAGAWSRSPYFCHFGAPIRDLNGLTLTIVGKGSLGTRTAALAEVFGMKVVFAEYKGAGHVRPGFTDFRQALSQADIVSLHCPLTAKTKGMIGAEELSWFKHDALLINTARGGLIDEAALLTALQEKRLGGAGLDVLCEEPPAADNALLSANLPNLIITPHIGWASQAAMSRLAQQLIENIDAWVAGTPQNLM